MIMYTAMVLMQAGRCHVLMLLFDGGGDFNLDWMLFLFIQTIAVVLVLLMMVSILFTRKTIRNGVGIDRSLITRALSHPRAQAMGALAR